MRRPWLSILPIVGLFLLITYSLYLMGFAAQKSDRFGELYIWLLLFNVLLLIILAGLIVLRLAGVIKGLITKEEGARLTWRLILMFVFSSLAPVLLVWAFSVRFLTSGIDAWFDVQIESSLEDALELSQLSLSYRMRQHQRQIQETVSQMVNLSDVVAGLALNDQRIRLGAIDLTLLGNKNRIIATSSESNVLIVPKFPSRDILVQLDRGRNYAGLEPTAEGDLRIRVIARVQRAGPLGESRVLMALFPVSGRINKLADRVQKAYGEYRGREFLRQPLKQSFRLTLSLVLLLSVLFAVWAAFFLARRLLMPIHELATATRAVAEGNYRRRLPVLHSDELGFLVQSFNEMTSRIRKAREAEAYSQGLVERQRSYLQTVLSNLSSGVLTLDDHLRIRTANESVNQLLEMDKPLEAFGGTHIADVARTRAVLQAFCDQLAPEMIKSTAVWSKEVRLFGAQGRKILLCHGISLPADENDAGGQVIVIDNVTDLIRAQRDAAWGEVARRLAHEIKNPLTPIQLSAERIEHKLAGQLPPDQAKVLTRSTQTIIKQVDAMKGMVNAFRDYASTPPAHPENLDINQLVMEVADLYHGYQDSIQLKTHLADDLPLLLADPARLRQVLHNLIKNAFEALGEQAGEIHVTSRYRGDSQGHYIELEFSDTGSGIDPELLENLFEPYVTSKQGGTGLGLAIVNKIVEEHGGMVIASNSPEGGARFTVRLPEKGSFSQPEPPAGP